MDEELEKLKKINELALRTLTMSRNTLLVGLRFLDRSLSMLKPYYVPLIGLATDGNFLFYDAVHVLLTYKEEKEAVVHDYLHIIMHCIFQHMYIHTLVNKECWDLACDIAVEYSIYGLNLKSAETKRSSSQIAEFKKLKDKGIMMTAEKLYRYYLDRNLSSDKLEEIRSIFISDNHEPWYMTEEEKQRSYGMKSSEQQNSQSDQQKENDQDSSEQSGNRKVKIIQELSGENQQDDGADGNQQDDGTDRNAQAGSQFTEKEWKEISEQIQMDMETFSRERGTMAGGLTQNLREVNREKYDYTAFLKKFAVMGEAMKINDDEFDYIFYTYGMKLYKKMPLVEPLEYKDVKRIKEFVIAIDTSGSVQGELVQKFIQKTYNILKSTESFFSKINLHIIQCDTEIQEDKIIHTQEEMEEYLKSMKLHGFGGTDFTPVFRYVDELQKNKEFNNLKGLIYFTDGYGLFPSSKPSYETAFVFVEDGYEIPEVPPWAIKLVLQSEEI